MIGQKGKKYHILGLTALHLGREITPQRCRNEERRVGENSTGERALAGGNSGLSAATEGRIRALPCWRGGIEIAPLSGGISNESYLVSDGAARHVVRLGQDFPFHHVLRERELMTARAAHAAGFGPEVRYAEPGVMVCAYLGARPLSAEDVVADRRRVATLLRGYHATMPEHVSGIAHLFWPFHVIRDYARTLKGANRVIPQLAAYLELAGELEAAQAPLPFVFGHNDLLPANILDDGERLWLIDYEYAGFSTAMFDLAGLTSNAGFSPDEAEDFLAMYFGAAPSWDIRRSHAAMQCASLLREAMWSMVSEVHMAAPGADYARHASENIERLELALEHYRTCYGKETR